MESSVEKREGNSIKIGEGPYIEIKKGKCIESDT